MTTRDVTDFKDGLRRQQGQAVATINRALVTLRRFFGWLVEQGHAQANPVKPVKELRKQQLAPKGMERGDVRRLLREIELAAGRAGRMRSSIYSYTPAAGFRDLVALELHDLMIGERSGSVVFRLGKGGKQRSVPLAAPGPSCIAGILGNPAADPIQQGFRRRTRPAWGSWHPGLVRQVFCLDRREAASRTCCGTRWPTSILRKQSRRSGRPGPNPRP